MHIVRSFIANTTVVWALLGGGLLFSIVLITTINVGAFSLDKVANIFSVSITGLSGYEDYISLAIACTVLMFFPYCQYHRGHIMVDFFSRKFTPTARQFLDKLWLIITLLISLFLAYQMFMGMLENRTDYVLTPILSWQIWFFYIPGILSLLLWSSVIMLQVITKSNSDLTNN